MQYININKRNKRRFTGYQEVYNIAGRRALTDLPLQALLLNQTAPAGLTFIRPNDSTISGPEIFYTVINGFTAVRLTGVLNTAQPGDGDLIAVLRKNGVNQTIQFIVFAGFQGANPTLGSVNFVTGDQLSIRLNNQSASPSGQITSVTLSAT